MYRLRPLLPTLYSLQSLGTELYFIRNNHIAPCREWIKEINDSGFLLANIPKAVKKATAYGIELYPQPEDYQGKFTRSFYYEDCPTSRKDLIRMGEIAIEYRIKLTYSLCNPAAGDPEGYYDLQFLPSCTGKDKVLQFLCNLWKVEYRNTWAVGDSFNDLQMIRNAAHGYYLANADPKVREYYPIQTTLPYCKGIKEILSQIRI